jgi:hypothetical protein
MSIYAASHVCCSSSTGLFISTGQTKLVFTLFSLLRYMSIAALVVSNIGFFSKFSELACRQFFLVPPSLKGQSEGLPCFLYLLPTEALLLVMAALISQIIIGRRYAPLMHIISGVDADICPRTYTLSGRAPWVKWSLVVLFGLSTVVRCSHIPPVSETHMGCDVA